MKPEELTQLTNEELIAKYQKMAPYSKGILFLIGLFGGIALCSTIINGVGFITFFPVIFIGLGFIIRATINELRQEIETRNLF